MTRIAGALGMMAGLVCLAGCMVANNSVSDRKTVDVGDAAAVMDRAVARNFGERIVIIESERHDMGRRRVGLLRDADDYRDLAAAVWTDPRLQPIERVAATQEYLAWAEQREAEAGRYREVIQAYATDICMIESRRHQRIREAAMLDTLKDSVLR